jgi:hypothetical protein
MSLVGLVFAAVVIVLIGVVMYRFLEAGLAFVKARRGPQ